MGEPKEGLSLIASTSVSMKLSDGAQNKSGAVAVWDDNAAMIQGFDLFLSSYYIVTVSYYLIVQCLILRPTRRPDETSLLNDGYYL